MSASNCTPPVVATTVERAVIVVLFTSLSSVPCAAQSTHDEPFGADKALHATVGAAIGGTCTAGLWALGSNDSPLLRAGICLGVAAIAGAGKELYDAGQTNNRVSGFDLMWTALGGAVGSLLVYAIERWSHR